MQVMLKGLHAIGFTDDATAIAVQWQALLQVALAESEPEYVRCYPASLLENVMQHAHLGTAGMGCRLATPTTQGAVHTLLNNAWHVFWERPHEYAEWEEQTISRLQQHLGATA
jgi:hypothetical protein